MTISMGAIDSHKPEECFIDNGMLVCLGLYETVVYVESEPSETSEKVFLAFANIDIGKGEEIIDFYKKYGDVGDILKEKVGEPPFEIGYRYAKVKDIKADIVIMQGILNLKEAIQTKNAQVAIEAIKKIYISNGQKSKSNQCFDDWNVILTDSISYRDLWYHSAKDMTSLFGTKVYKANGYSLNECINKNSPSITTAIDARYLQNLVAVLLHSNDQNVLFSEINKLAIAETNDYIGNNDYNVDINKFLSISQELLRGIINAHLKKVEPVLMIEKGKYKTKWKCEDLLSAMYLQLSFSISENKMFKKCACSTCNNYFEIYGNDKRKIYCTTRCAQLEAKRKQRKREHIKKEGAKNGNNSEAGK